MCSCAVWERCRRIRSVSERRPTESIIPRWIPSSSHSISSSSCRPTCALLLSGPLPLFLITFRVSSLRRDRLRLGIATNELTWTFWRRPLGECCY
ncbi:unnamed protein product, partial [Nesidiocoris tenuis]